MFIPEVHALTFKFCILNFGGSAVKEHDAADFVFFTHKMEDLEERQRHIAFGYPATTFGYSIQTRERARSSGRVAMPRLPRPSIVACRCSMDRKSKKGPTGNPWGIN